MSNWVDFNLRLILLVISVKSEPEFIVVCKRRSWHDCVSHRDISVLNWDFKHISSICPHIEGVIQTVNQGEPFAFKQSLLHLLVVGKKTFLFKYR